MNAATLQRYAPGGDIYRRLQTEYGFDGAETVFRAAQDDHAAGENGRVADAIAQLRHGNPLPEGTGGILVEQLITDPLGAPLDSANTLLANSTSALLRNPIVLLFVVGGFWVWLKSKGKL